MSSIAASQVRQAHGRRARQRPWRNWLITAVLAASDALAFAAGYLAFRRGQAMPAFLLPSVGSNPDYSSATDVYLVMGALFIVVRYILGDYARRQLFWDGVRATTSTVLLISIPDLLLASYVGRMQIYLLVILSWLFLIVAIPLLRQLARKLMSSIGLWQIPTALIGTGRKACNAYSGLRNTLSLGFDVCYLVAEGDEDGIPAGLKPLRRINASEPDGIASALLIQNCRQVIVSAEDAQEQQISRTIQRLIGSDINVAVIPSLQGLPLFGMSTSYLFGQDMLLLQLRNNLARTPSRVTKRIVDVIGPIVIMLISSPLWLFVMAAIKLHDGGPIFYAQTRIGKDGRPFPCIKFRTMAVDADELLARWRDENPALYSEFLKTFKLPDDPRITGPGKWLRRSSLDELPQLFNVLAGHMSLVGPRPIIQRELIEYYGPAAELYKRVRPGLTGLWQISGRSDTSYADRVAYDEWYILNWSMWYDIVILLQTAWIVLARKGAF